MECIWRNVWSCLTVLSMRYVERVLFVGEACRSWIDMGGAKLLIDPAQKTHVASQRPVGFVLRGEEAVGAQIRHVLDEGVERPQRRRLDFSSK